MASSVLIRRARHDEAPTVADVQARSWRETYAGDLSADALASIHFDAGVWAKRIEAAGRVGATSSVWVAESNDKVVGFAACGPDLDADEGTTRGQLYAIYILREAQGLGVGRRLHQQALDALRQAGFTEATLWVLRTNATAIRFYEIDGWRADGTSRPGVDGFQQPEVRFRRALGGATDDY